LSSKVQLKICASQFFSGIGETSKLRETPKAFVTTLQWKRCEGPRLIAVL